MEDYVNDYDELESDISDEDYQDYANRKLIESDSFWCDWNHGSELL